MEERRGFVAKVEFGEVLAQRIGRDQLELPNGIRVGLELIGGQSLFPILSICLSQALNHISVIKGKVCTPQLGQHVVCPAEIGCGMPTPTSSPTDRVVL